MKVSDFLKNQSWLEGPSFLWKSEANWPVSHHDVRMDSEDPEVRKDAYVNAIVYDALNATDHLISYFSCWRRLKVAVAWFLRLKGHLLELSRQRKASGPQTSQVGGKRATVKQQSSVLTPKDLEEAELAVIGYCQQQRFATEISSLLSEKRTVSRQSSIYKLDPILENGLLRVGGRLSKGAMPSEEKHPLILSKEQHISKLLLRNMHQLLGHSGRNHTLSTLRRKYWITNANAAVRKIISQCSYSQTPEWQGHGTEDGGSS